MNQTDFPGASFPGRPPVIKVDIWMKYPEDFGP